MLWQDQCDRGQEGKIIDVNVEERQGGWIWDARRGRRSGRGRNRRRAVWKREGGGRNRRHGGGGRGIRKNKGRLVRRLRG